MQLVVGFALEEFAALTRLPHLPQALHAIPAHA